MDLKNDAKLFDLQIGDGADSDTLMSIETGSIKDDLLAIFLYLLILISTAVAGYYGPKLYKSGTIDIKYHQSIYLGPRNRYLKLNLMMNVEKPTGTDQVNLQFDYAIKFNKKGQEVKEVKQHFHNYVGILPNETVTKPFEFFYDQFVKYDEADVLITFDKASSYTGGSLIWETLDGNHAFFNIWLRAIFIVSTIIVLALFMTRLFYAPGYNFEQILTSGMGLIAIYGTNPLYILLVFFPHQLFSYVEDLALGISPIAVIATLALILLNTALKHKKEKLFSLIPAFLYFVIFTVVSLFKEFGKERFFSDNFVSLISIIYNVLFGISAIAILVLAAVSFFQTDESEKRKIVVYSLVAVLTLFFFAFSLAIENPRFNSTCGMAIKIAQIHCYAILLIYFHWPYEASIDQQYNEGFNTKDVEDFEPSVDEEQISKMQINIEESDQHVEQA